MKLGGPQGLEQLSKRIWVNSCKSAESHDFNKDMTNVCCHRTRSLWGNWHFKNVRNCLRNNRCCWFEEEKGQDHLSLQIPLGSVKVSETSAVERGNWKGEIDTGTAKGSWELLESKRSPTFLKCIINKLDFCLVSQLVRVFLELRMVV